MRTVENFAQLLHHYYCALGPEFDRNAEPETEWRALDGSERRRLVAATRLALLESSALSDDLEANVVSSDRSLKGTEGKECGC